MLKGTLVSGFHRVSGPIAKLGNARHNDLVALSALNTLQVGFVPWSSMAMRPQGLLTVLNDIVINGHVEVVECGAGVSTVFIAKLLATMGIGNLSTIEHDASWARVVRGVLAREGLNDHCTVTVAPLTPGNGRRQWYSEAILDDLRLGKVDLLLVDGPPAFTRDLRHARHPALGYFFERLAPDCTVILDDINRRGEQEVCGQWEAEFNARFDRRPRAGGIAVWRRGGAPPVA